MNTYNRKGVINIRAKLRVAVNKSVLKVYTNAEALRRRDDEHGQIDNVYGHGHGHVTLPMFRHAW